MSKNAKTRVAKFAGYRKQISKMKDVEQSAHVDDFQAATIREAKKIHVNTTTSLDAETILKEIEKREDPTGQAKLEREKELKRTTIIQWVTIILSSAISLTLLTLLFIYLYRRLS